MPEQQPIEVTPENLRQFEEELAGYSTPKSEPAASADSDNQTVASPEAEASATPAPPAASQAQAVEDFSKYLEGTPFKNIDEVVKGWKNAAGELTRKSQRIKPYEEILGQADTDPAYAEYLRQAHQQYLAYKANPQAFQQSQQAPDLYTPEGIQAYIKQNLDRETATMRMQYQQELAKVQQQAQFENMKAQFKAKFPDADPDEIFNAWQEMVSQLNPFEIAYRVKNFDKVQNDATSKARQEVNKQLETAGKTKTPTASTKANETAKAEDILDHVARYGSDAAFKRFGKKETMSAIEEAEKFLS